MPILKRVKGDLIKMFLDKGNQDVVTFAHGCNCMRIMGSGIAGQVAQYLPALRDVDSQFGYEKEERRLGTFTAHMFTELDKLGVNLYTQKRPASRPGEVAVCYMSLAKAFYNMDAAIVKAARQNSKFERMKNVGIPLIGAGLAGGDWNTIENIINQVTPDLNITLVEYQPQP